MSSSASNRSTRRILRTSVWLILIGGTLYGPAHTWPVIILAWRAARGTRYEPVVVRWYLSIHGGPVEKALADGRIKSGQSVDEVVAAHGPFHVETVGPYQRLAGPLSVGGISFEGYGIVAKDGRLVGAGWATCTGRVTFFDTLTPAEWGEVSEAFRKHRDQLWEAERAAWMAVSGVAAQTAWESPPPAPEHEP